MPQERNLKSRKSRCSRQLRARRRSGDLPAGLRGARRGCHPHAQQENGNARGLCDEFQTPAGGQVEFLGSAPGRNHDGPERRAARRLGSGPQDARAIADPHEQKPLGPKPQFRQTGRIQSSRLTIGKFLPDPAQGTPFARPTGENSRKSRRIDVILEAPRIDLMDCSPLQPAPEMIVESGKPQGNWCIRPLSALERAPAECFCQIAGKEGSSHHTVTYVHFTFYNSLSIWGRVK